MKALKTQHRRGGRFFVQCLVISWLAACATSILPVVPSPVEARQILVRVGENYMTPNDIHVFSDDWVSFINESSILTHISFGENCTRDDEKNSAYGNWPFPLLPGELKTTVFDQEPHGTVLHIFSDTRCKSAVATITVYDPAQTFEKWIPEGTIVHTNDLADHGKGGALTFSNLGIAGTLILDGDTQITVLGKGMPSPQLEVFRFTGKIECELDQPTEPGTNGPNGYNLVLNLTGPVNLTGGAVNLNGGSGTEGIHGQDAVATCSPNCYPNSYCSGSCTYYDDDQCITGCTVCDSGWRLPEGCNDKCGACHDQELVEGISGGPGGNGGMGGKGGSFTLSHVGELYGYSLGIVTNGGSGGAGGGGGGGFPGCDQLKCNETIRKAVPGAGGPAGNPGPGGDGGTVTINTTGYIADDYYPARYFGVSAKGGSGGKGGMSGYNPNWSKTPGHPNTAGAFGGSGGKVTVNAGCTLLQPHMEVGGGTGGRAQDEQEGSIYGGANGGKGGQAGEIIILAGVLDDDYSLLHAEGGQGGAGGECSGKGYPGGDGGAGGNGGTISVKASSIEMLPQRVFVQGGSGGAGGECGNFDGNPGPDGGSGSYDPQQISNENLRVSAAADGKAEPGEILEYTILVSAQNAKLTNVVVTSPVPAGTTYVSASGRHTRSGNQVTWTIDTLAPCQGETLFLRVRIDPNAQLGTQITNQVTAACDGQSDVQSDPVNTLIEESDDGDVDLESIFGHGGNQLPIAEPVNPAIGNYIFSKELFSYPGRGLPIRFFVTYNSRDNGYAGPLGMGWTHTFNVTAFLDSESGLTIKWGDGHKECFQRGEKVYVPVKSYTDVTVSDLDTGGYQATLPNGTRYIFNIAGMLQSIGDLNGNTIQLAYTDTTYPYYVTQVTDTAGRKLLFSYSGGFLTRITGPLTQVDFQYDAAGDLAAIIDRSGKSRHFTYNGKHQIVEYIDAKGRKIVTNTYDDQGRVVSQKNSLGQVTTFAYTSSTSENSTTITPPGGRPVVHTFDKNFNLIKVVDGEGGSATFKYNGAGKCVEAGDKNGLAIQKAYDAAGNAVSMVDRLQGSTTAEYNSLNRATAIKDPLGHTMTAAYDDRGNLLSITDPLGRTTQYTNDASGQLLTTVDPKGRALSFEYDAQGLPATVRDALGNKTTIEYDEAGRPTTFIAPDQNIRVDIQYDAGGNPIRTTDPKGRVTRMVYDANGNLVERNLDPLGVRFQYAYDALNRVSSITDPENGVTTYEYDSMGNVVSITDPDGVSTAFSYDDSNRLTAVTHPGGGVTTYDYDANGNRTSVQDAVGAVSRLAYDAENHLISITSANGKKIRMSYDDLGRLTSRKDELGRVTKMEYDAAGKLITRVFPDGSKWQYGYDTVGNLVRATDELGRSWKFAYDKGDRLIKVTDPEGKSLTYTYDGSGRLVGRTDRNRDVTTYVYDDNNQVVKIKLPGSQTISFTYDAAGRTLSSKGPWGTVKRTYDKMGRVLTLTDENGKTLAYQYTPAGRTAAITYPGGKKVTYAYDAAGRLSTVKDWLGHTTTYFYDKLNRVVRIDLPNGSKAGRSYDGMGRLTKLIHTDSNGRTLVSYALTYDNAGQIVKAVRKEPTTPKVSGYSTRSTYSKANRILAAVRTGQTTEFSHDKSGNMTSKTAGKATTSFDYDALNRLISVQGPSGTTGYTYDGVGNRSSKIHNGVRERYLADGNAVLYQYQPSGTAERYFIRGGSLLYSVSENGDVWVYHTDERGSVTAVTDGSQKVVQALSYDPYGRILARKGDMTNDLRFLGLHGVRTDENGLCYMNARYYDPEIARFINEDPLGPLSGFNLYAYAAGNPIGRIDPSGMKDQDGLGQVQPSGDATQTNQAPTLPVWVSTVDLGMNAVGLVLSEGEKWAVWQALKSHDILRDTETGIKYVVPKDLTKLKSPIPLGKFQPPSAKVMSVGGKVLTGLDIGINVYNAASTTYNYSIKHGPSRFIKDLGNGDVDALSVVHDTGMALNSSFLGIVCPPASAGLTATDYAVTYYVAPIYQNEISRQAEYNYLETRARYLGHLKGLQLRNDFNAELAKLNADLDDLAKSFHGSNFGDGLHGCTVE